jgi:hypothetical protein
MLVKYHILIGFIASILIFLLFPQIGWFYALIIFLSTFLIDFDHYLYYAVKKKDLSLKRAYAWFVKHRDQIRKLKPSEREKYKRGIFIFHGIECVALLALLSYVHPLFAYVLAGVLIHMVFDFMDLYTSKEPFYIKISQIYVFMKNKGKKELR